MKLALTLEADSINVQALNMGQIVVDVDGVNLAELINVVAENGYSLVWMNLTNSQPALPPFATLTGIRCSTAHITEKDNAGCTRCRTRPVTLVNQNGFISQVADICYVPMRGHIRFCGLNARGCQNVPSSGYHTYRRYGVSLIHLDASAECLPGLPTFNW